MDERGASVFVTWGPGEEDLALRLVGATGHRAVQSPRITHLQHLVRVLSQADLFVGGDTGPMHIASALGRPVVALFGPKDPRGTGPYCSRSEVVTAPVECRPWSRRRCPDPRCMTQIAVDQVVHACRRLLDGRGEVRARSGLLRRPFSVEFELGRWRGEARTDCSMPAFYRLVAELSAGRLPPGTRTADGEWDRRVEVTVDGERRRTLLAWPRQKGPNEQDRSPTRPGGNARNYWRSAFRLLQEDLPARFPVCFVRRKGILRKNEILMVEEVPGCRPLTAALNSSTDRGALMHALALLVRRLHLGGQYHGDLGPRAILVDGAGRLFFERLHRGRSLRWVPPLLRELAWGLDVRRLIRRLRDVLSQEELRDFTDAYCEGLPVGPVRLRLLKWFVG
jgi:hypothetical protein